MKFRYRIVYEDGESHEVDASDVWIALCKTGAILRASEVRSVQKLEQPAGEAVPVWAYSDDGTRMSVEAATA